MFLTHAHDIRFPNLVISLIAIFSHGIRKDHDRQHLRGQHWAPEKNPTPVERNTLSFYHTNLSQLPLSEDTLLFSCRAQETWIGDVEAR